MTELSVQEKFNNFVQLNEKQIYTDENGLNYVSRSSLEAEKIDVNDLYTYVFQPIAGQYIIESKVVRFSLNEYKSGKRDAKLANTKKAETTETPTGDAPIDTSTEPDDDDSEALIRARLTGLTSHEIAGKFKKVHLVAWAKTLNVKTAKRATEIEVAEALLTFLNK